ncbi:MAG: trypsin-like serine protease [Bdellovibrio sp.]
MKLISVGMLLSVAAITGCSKDEENLVEPANCEIAGDNYGITNGNSLGAGNDLSATTVFVYTQQDDESGNICTGTLIDNDKVLTAAHCVEKKGTTFVAFTNSMDCAAAAPSRTLRVVTDKVIHPNYRGSEDRNKSAYDLAVLKFSGNSPEGFYSRDLPTAPVRFSAANDVVVTGYGRSKSYDSGGVGALRYKALPGSSLSRSYYSQFLQKTVDLTRHNILVLDQRNGGVCSGDSGGPLYIKTPDGGLSLAGITSKGINPHSADGDGDVCFGVALFAEVQPNLEWIRESMRRLSY